MVSLARFTAWRVPTRVKQRVFLGALVLLLIWPLVHFALARRYHINHWRFAGFGMYTRPADLPRLSFAGRVGDRPLTPDLLRAALGDDSGQIDAFIARRKLWGELAGPEPVGRLILRRLPELGELTILVITIGLAPGDDYLSYSVDHYRCRRSRMAAGPACQRQD